MLIKFDVEVFFLGLFGAATMLLGGVLAIFESDLKKVVAYSTLSQLGLITLGLGAGSVEWRYFHLLSHAFFKSILFICVGVRILGFFHNQQGSKVSLTFSRITRVCFFGSLFSMGGVFFLSGFFSKHILFLFFFGGGFGWGFRLLFIVGVLLTSVYVFRLLAHQVAGGAVSGVFGAGFFFGLPFFLSGFFSKIAFSGGFTSFGLGFFFGWFFWGGLFVFLLSSQFSVFVGEMVFFGFFLSFLLP